MRFFITKKKGDTQESNWMELKSKKYITFIRRNFVNMNTEDVSRCDFINTIGKSKAPNKQSMIQICPTKI